MARLVSVVLCILIGFPALAQAPQCGPRADLVTGMSEKYGEAAVFRGLNTHGIFEVWLNKETGTWTVISTDIHGKTCVLTFGEAGGDAPPIPVGDPT